MAERNPAIAKRSKELCLRRNLRKQMMERAQHRAQNSACLVNLLCSQAMCIKLNLYTVLPLLLMMSILIFRVFFCGKTTPCTGN